MELEYHQQICTEAIGEFFSPEAMSSITAANFRQDGLFTGLVGYPHYHFDDNKLAKSWAYIADQRQLAVAVLRSDQPTKLAWQAFGRLSHSAQDFYSHSNYIRLWLKTYSPDALPTPEQFDGLDETILHHPRLFTCKVYYPIEAVTYFPVFRPWARRTLPEDSHSVMNLDDPARGPLFPLGMEGARQITRREYDSLIASLSPAQINRFHGMGLDD